MCHSGVPLFENNTPLLELLRTLVFSNCKAFRAPNNVLELPERWNGACGLGALTPTKPPLSFITELMRLTPSASNLAIVPCDPPVKADTVGVALLALTRSFLEIEAEVELFETA